MQEKKLILIPKYSKCVLVDRSEATFFLTPTALHFNIINFSFQRLILSFDSLLQHSLPRNTLHQHG